MDKGKYIYCIIGTDKEKEFDVEAIGDPAHRVYTVGYRDIAAVVSDSPVEEYEITRENTLAHQRVMEGVMREHTVLPVRFNTIAESNQKNGPEARINQEVLKRRSKEFKDLLAELNGKEALGVKALWTDMDLVYAEIATNNRTIRRLRGKRVSRDTGIEIGHQVRAALEEKKEREERAILNVLKEVSHDFCINEGYGDRMVTNASFLVETDRREAFDDRLDQLMTKRDGRMVFKYVGPMPPSDFVEIVVNWEA
ncbi:MAG: GvpL/GvpF family gas vesicle protein [Candidatus Bipolaricaulia bacterium]